jgi:hypothetical protein
MLSPARRRELGAFYTPPDVAARLVGLALDGLDGLDGAPIVCDPACGDGAFLLAAGELLTRRGLSRARVARDLLWGCDIDQDAVALTRQAIIEWSNVDPADHLVVADGLSVGERWGARFDAVVGNPPFLNQLERATVRRTPLPATLAEFAGPYTDTAWLFLVAALGLARPGGRVVLVQPQSLIAARDAKAVRDAVEPLLEGMWWCDELLFDATVRVCAPVLGPKAGARARRWSGRDASEVASIDWPQRSWSALLALDVPDVDLSGSDATLGTITTATAGFRDEYYGLSAAVIDEPDGDLPLLITSGLVDVGRVLWGARSTRFAGRRLAHPRVDPSLVATPVQRWVRQRLVPKVVVATQTKVVEAAVDVEGAWVPSTPVISVHTDAADLWRVAAVLTAPAVSAWALRHHAGAALNPGAIKLSAGQVLQVPLPTSDSAWQQGAKALAAGRIVDAGDAMSRAYDSGDQVLEWWRSRLPRTVGPY